MGPLTVYVPRGESLLRAVIKQGSGIVGTPVRDWFHNQHEDPEDAEADRIVIDYEGNLYGAANVVTFADRVLHAAGRHQAVYPTAARSVVKKDELVAVAEWDGACVNLLADESAMAALADWLGQKIERSELISSSARLAMPDDARAINAVCGQPIYRNGRLVGRCVEPPGTEHDHENARWSA